MLHVGHFYGLHLIVNFGSEADAALKTVEAAMLEGKNPYSFGSSESGTFRLIRTICKAFEEHRSDEAGVSSHFSTFVLGKGKESNLASFRRNRINIIFYNAMTVYYHREHFVEILRKWPDANRLLKSVDTDLTCEVYLAGVRALGIIDKIITALLWRLLESNVNIAEMGTHYKKLQLSFQEWQQDVSSMITRESVFVTSNSRHFLRDTQILLMKSLNKFFKYFVPTFSFFWNDKLQINFPVAATS